MNMILATALTAIRRIGDIATTASRRFTQRLHQAPSVSRFASLALVALSLVLGSASTAQAQTHLSGSAVRTELSHSNRGASTERQKVLANNLSLEGTYAYNISGGTVRLQVQTLANRRSGGSSGSLRVELWALASPYSGGNATGYKIGQTSVLSPLSAGFQYTNIDQTVTQNSTPPIGTWYMHMFITEYTASSLNDGFSFVDWEMFTNPWVISGAAYPDLVVTNVFIGTHSATINQRISFQSTTVRNDGTASAPAGARVKFYWSTNDIISGLDTYSGWYCDLGALAPGQSTTCSGEVDAPATPGTYYFGAYVNESGAITESDYVNNTGYDPLAVIVTTNTSATIPAIEFYNPSFNYYFITSRPGEIALLDAAPSFVRTGQSFLVYVHPDAFSGRKPITRFYFDKIAVGGLRGSHFYTLVQSELNALTSLNPANVQAPRVPYNEGVDSYAYLPVVEGVGGYCSAGLIPVYRIFRGNARFPDNPNHRFTTSAFTYNSFVAQGWDGEGVKFCVPG